MIMKRAYQLLLLLALSALLFLSGAGCQDLGGSEATTAWQENETTAWQETGTTAVERGQTIHLDEDGSYTTKEDVKNYLIEYGRLPSNFITKKEAKKLGWQGGSLERFAPGKCIGGDYYGNYEGNLPDEDGVTYHECDIDTLGAKKRGPKRIVYSDDGRIYYTEDHYNTFTLLYGEED